MMKGAKRARSYASKGANAIVPVSTKQANDNLAKRVVALSKLVRALKPELKYLDLNLSGVNVSVTNGAVACLTQCAAGTGVYERVGENITITSMLVNFEIILTNSFTQTDPMTCCRFYIAQDTQSNASTAPVGSDLVDQPPLPALQLYKVQEQGRFKVLYDSKPMYLAQWHGVAQMGTARSPHRLVKKKLNIPVSFNGTGYSDYQKNAIWLFVYTNATIAAANSFDYNCISRLTFTDV